MQKKSPASDDKAIVRETTTDRLDVKVWNVTAPPEASENPEIEYSMRAR